VTTLKSTEPIKGFVTSYLNRTIKIRFQDVKEIIWIAKKNGKKITHKEALQEEIDKKVLFTNLIEICSGSKKVTQKELEDAFSQLYKIYIFFVNGDRIEGEITKHSVEERLENIENKLFVLGKDVEELQESRKKNLFELEE
jgi:hypothetical protein